MDAEYDRKRARSLTSDETTSLDSFVSAPETPDLTDLEVILHHRRLYNLESGFTNLRWKKYLARV